MIDRYLLRYFLAVVDTGNFSKAALQCNVSQPTLSVGVAKLERELGKPLFHRTNRRVEVTEAGVRLAAHARRIEAEFALAERAVGDSVSRAPLRLGVLATIPTRWISAFLGDLRRYAPEEHIELVEGRERDLHERLNRGRIDAALSIVHGEADRFAATPLLREGYSLAMPDSHRLAGEPVVAAEELADNVMIVRRQCELLAESSRHFTSRGVRPFFAARTMNDDRALAFVQAGLGVTLMPDGYTAEGIARPRLAEFNFTREIGILFAPYTDQIQQRHSIVEILAGTIAGLNAARA